ncbi:MAG: mandelate racemase/muconate lactonizing enzyme family protein [Sphaerochaeta sp.]|nr:mandelate racemase/muconate lactonizing enzyme family protein [Sphaerochaeta sp.]
MKIKRVSAVILTGNYADSRDAEVLIHLNNQKRHCGIVEIELENGVTGIGEGYMAVFAPIVFKTFTEFYAPHLIGKDGFAINELYAKCCNLTNYFSLQGAARHVISAIEMALWDAKAKTLGLPVYDLLGGRKSNKLKLYASAGDFTLKAQVDEELVLCKDLGIDTLKIRLRERDVNKGKFVLHRADKIGIKIAIDFCQNITVPSLGVSDIIRFINEIIGGKIGNVQFIEEALGPNTRKFYPEFRNKIPLKFAGGETLTTPEEFFEVINQKYFDYVQPDSSVCGGISAVYDICKYASAQGISSVVHNWGSSISLMANYHAAIASGCLLAEWPIKKNHIRDQLFNTTPEILNGYFIMPNNIGLGVTLTDRIRAQNMFDPTCNYQWDGEFTGLPDDEYWK